jgi:hypothetical protein
VLMNGWTTEKNVNSETNSKKRVSIKNKADLVHRTSSDNLQPFLRYIGRCGLDKTLVGPNVSWEEPIIEVLLKCLVQSTAIIIQCQFRQCNDKSCYF